MNTVAMGDAVAMVTAARAGGENDEGGLLRGVYENRRSRPDDLCRELARFAEACIEKLADEWGITPEDALGRIGLSVAMEQQ